MGRDHHLAEASRIRFWVRSVADTTGSQTRLKLC
jgi:hypothetical protein